MNVYEQVEKARDLMESFDTSYAMTVGFDEQEYTLTSEQMNLIASALYLADCELNENKNG